ncbi:M56 family metallopeptidase [uncultured Polaribacter sp.]|uniref:M56 family metallopeptidase n=1 Tax=uncultured Polaribacter sp. TaxID=174711 RepID=UPI0026265D07|nr:M56 family metallopeptidase [uncultured Polaribacter sp.]
MINYIIQVILFQVLFLVIYDFFLSKETFFIKNRGYLLSTPILSFLLPFVKIPTFQEAVPQEIMVYLPEIMLSPEKVIQETSWYQSINYLDVLFGVGVIVFSVLFLVKLLQIINLIRSYKLIQKEDYTLVLIPNQTKAFSFFNYIFLGKEIPESQKTQIIAHELVHSKQKHSLDLLFFEFLKIVMWFNPMIFIYQKRITLVHEYISDEIATKSTPKESYINNLLSNLFQVENIAFINQFYKQTLLKKRIMMMTKKQSKKMNQLKYLVLIPVLMSMLFYTSCSETELKDNLETKKELFKMFTLSSDGELNSFESKKETFLDAFLGVEVPKEFKEIYFTSLKNHEKEEFEEMKKHFEKNDNDNYYMKLRLFEMQNGRKVVAMILKNNILKERVETERVKSSDNSVNFMVIDKAPTFPGCDSGDKGCFSKMIQKHFIKYFNADLPNQLGLESGKKRIFIGFKINESGDITDIKARAPHIDIKNEVIRIMETLPKMIPGENNGKTVSVSYNIPFAIIVQ